MQKLRDYQEKCIENILNKYKQRVKHQIIILATGTGKTQIFTHLASNLIRKTGKKVLILGHRNELLLQAQSKLSKVDPNLRIGIEQANSYADHKDDNVIIASVQTLGKANSKRIKRFDPNDFCLIIIDETHHFSIENSTYANIIRYFKLLKSEPENDTNDALLLGVTATAQRGDSIGLDKSFDEVTYTYGIIDGIKDGWLSRIRAYRVDTTTSLEEVHTVAGDFAQNELGDTVNTPERNGTIVKAYIEQFWGKQTICFTVNVTHAIDLQQTFEKHGVKSAYVTGETPKDERKQLLDDFYNKKIQVMLNCNILSEGYDNPSVECIFMCAPTKSTIRYQQQIGRGTRIYEGKEHLTIVDIVDNVLKHKIQTSASILGISSKINFAGHDILEAQEQIDKIHELAPTFDLDKLNMGKLDYLMEEIDLLSGLDIPRDIEPITKFSWYRYGDGYRLGIGDSRYFVVEQDILGKWVASFEYFDRDSKKIISEWLGEEEVRDFIIQRVDKFIKNNYKEALRLIKMDAHWRKEKITEPQYLALKKIGVSDDVLQQLTKGQASQLQSKLYSQKRRYV